MKWGEYEGRGRVWKRESIMHCVYWWWVFRLEFRPGVEQIGLARLAWDQVTKDFRSGFPDGRVVKNLPASTGDTIDMDLIPGSGRSPRIGNSNSLQYSCLENSTVRGVWWATYSPWGCKGLGMTEHRHKYWKFILGWNGIFRIFLF